MAAALVVNALAQFTGDLSTSDGGVIRCTTVSGSRLLTALAGFEGELLSPNGSRVQVTTLPVGFGLYYSSAPVNETCIAITGSLVAVVPTAPS